MVSHGLMPQVAPSSNYSGFDQWNSKANGVYIKWKPLLKGAQIPKQATNHSGGYDLFLPEDVHLKAMEVNQVIKLGFSLAFSPDYHAVIKARSSSAYKYKIDIFPGLIDSDYDGMLCLMVTNLENIDKHFAKGCRLAQIVFYPSVKQRYINLNSLSLPPECCPTPEEKLDGEKDQTSAETSIKGSGMWPLKHGKSAGEKDQTTPETKAQGEGMWPLKHLGWGSTGE